MRTPAGGPRADFARPACDPGGVEQQPNRRVRIAVLASGAGSTFRALIGKSRTGQLPAEIALLITTKAGAPVAQHAGPAGAEHLFLDAAELGPDGVDSAVCQALVDREIDLVVLAGYLRKIGARTRAAFAGRIVNTHPAPLPAFGGPGMYGERVHHAVLTAGVRYSAATVHLIDDDYDTGPVIAERPVPVHPDDTAASLQERVQAAERDLLVSTLAALINSPGWNVGGR
jgi:phosphoribosylglycinamide formyltransferase-1